MSFTTGDMVETLSITALANGENNYDFGAIVLGTVNRTFSNSEVRQGTSIANCEWILRQTGTSSDFVTYTKQLLPNTTYYIYFCYACDGGTTGGFQALKVKKIERRHF